MTAPRYQTLRHSIRGRLLLFNILVVVSALLTGGIAWFGFSYSSAQLNQLQQQTLSEIKTGRELGMRLAQMATEAVRLVQVTGAIEYQTAVKQLNHHIEEVHATLDKVAEGPLATNAPQRIKQIQVHSGQFEHSIVQLLELAHQRHMHRSELLGLAHQALLELDRLQQLQHHFHTMQLNNERAQVLRDKLQLATGIPAPFTAIQQLADGLPLVADIPPKNAALNHKLAELNGTLGQMLPEAQQLQRIDTGILYHNYRIKALIEWLVEDITAYIDRSGALSQQRSNQLQQALANDKLRVLGLIALALLISAAAGRYIYSSLGPQLVAIAHAMRRLAAGERDVTVPALKRRDEIGDLARAFNVFHHNAQALQTTMALLAEKSNQLQNTFETMRDGFALFDTNDQLTTCNQQYRQLLQLSDQQQLSSMTFASLCQELNADEITTVRGPLNTLPTQLSAMPPSLDITFADGRVVELRTSPLPTGGTVNVVLDRTRRKTLEAAFNHDQKLKALGQLTGGIAHDFNNLLTIMVGNLELLADRPDTPRTLRRIALAQHAAERATQLTSRLLAFSRKQALRPRAVDLNQLLDDIWDLLNHAVPANIQLQRHLNNPLWLAYIDANPLENALLNLVSNACDAIGTRQQGQITLSVENKEITRTNGQQQEMVVLSVIDNGCGMDDTTRLRMFDPFFTTKPPGAGNGLGLSVVYGFIRQSGGRVKVSSQRHVGTTIELQLPRAFVPEAICSPSRCHITPPPTQQLVLLLEDNDQVRQTLCDQLSALDYLTLDAADGATALAYLDTSPEIDILISDVQLANGEDGVEIVKQAQKQRPKLKILLISGHDERRLNQVSPTNYPLLHKPFHQHELAMALSRICTTNEPIS